PDDPRMQQVTIRRILSHSSGLAHVRPEGSSTIPFVFDPGEKFGYSTEGLMMLSKAVEKITGKKTETVMNEAVLAPLKMNDSSFVWLDKYEKSAVSNHDSFGQPAGERYKHKRGLACCSMLTTAADYAAFVIAAMDGKLLKRSTWTEMVKPQILLGEKTPQLSWGLGWGIEKTQADEYLWHWGDNGISKSYVGASLRRKDAVVFFANSDNGLSFAKEILDLTVSGEHQSLAWLNYDRYDSTGGRLFDAIISNGAHAALKEHLIGRAKDPGIALDESQMNVMGYKFLQSKRLDDAISIFAQNTIDHPNSANTWDSLAEAHMQKGDTALAIKYYEKSLQLDPKNENAVAMLKKLKSEK
ncbi:MAG: serine hydrolase, partial [Pyrinomonadaceae bacterium]